MVKGRKALKARGEDEQEGTVGEQAAVLCRICSMCRLQLLLLHLHHHALQVLAECTGTRPCNEADKGPGNAENREKRERFTRRRARRSRARRPRSARPCCGT